MELKPGHPLLTVSPLAGLNRTFYGIETSGAQARCRPPRVLIVPFMELKLSEGEGSKTAAES